MDNLLLPIFMLNMITNLRLPLELTMQSTRLAKAFVFKRRKDVPIPF